MSFDLMVFDPRSAPTDRTLFMNWYRDQTRWSEAHTYDDPVVSTPKLRGWFMDMIGEFPAMNGPYRTQSFESNPKVSDYCIGRAVIYVAFAWSQAEAAYHAMFERAKKHAVGFFDVSADDGEVWLPTDTGAFECIHGTSQPGTPRVIIAVLKKEDDT